MQHMLHENNFKRIPFVGWLIKRRLESRAVVVSREAAAMLDPNVSIVIRTRNDDAHIRQLFEDIKAQDFDGNIEIVVVDTESNDGTADYAKSQGANVIRIRQEKFNYPLALNMGFSAAKYPWVVSLVGHSALTSRMMLRSLTTWCATENLGGLYGVQITNWNGSFWERLAAMPCLFFLKKPFVARGSHPGMLGANCSIIRRDVWKLLGGFDERYAGGGEDTALARSMLDKGFKVVREPLCSVFHSHGLNFINSIKQWLHWLEVSKRRPQPFSTAKVHARRPDLRKNSPNSR